MLHNVIKYMTIYYYINIRKPFYKWAMKPTNGSGWGGGRGPAEGIGEGGLTPAREGGGAGNC